MTSLAMSLDILEESLYHLKVPAEKGGATSCPYDPAMIILKTDLEPWNILIVRLMLKLIAN